MAQDVKMSEFTLDVSVNGETAKCLFFCTPEKWDQSFTKSSINQWPSPDLIFTHGKGTKLESPPLRGFARGFASGNKNILCFEGNDDMYHRVSLFRILLSQYPNVDLKKVGFGGRSMGNRAGVQAAFYTGVKRLVCFAYPFYSSDSGDGLAVRDEELMGLGEECEVLFMIGTKDDMGAYPIVDKVRKSMRAKSWLVKIPQVDHSFGYKGLKNASQDQIHAVQNKLAEELGRVAAEWWDGKDGNATESKLVWDKEAGKAVFSGWGPGDGYRTLVVTSFDVSGVNGGSWTTAKRLR